MIPIRCVIANRQHPLMKQFADFLPLILFLVTFKTMGIYPAVLVLIISTTVFYGYLWWKEGRLENNHKIILAATIVFGSLSLALHDDAFIKWKAPVINWVIALIFLGSHFIGEKLAVERMMGSALEMPRTMWSRLSFAWIGFFVFLGTANWYVAFHHEQYWVDFKVFGSLILTVVFVVAQVLVLSNYIRKEEQEAQ